MFVNGKPVYIDQSSGGGQVNMVGRGSVIVVCIVREGRSISNYFSFKSMENDPLFNDKCHFFYYYYNRTIYLRDCGCSQSQQRITLKAPGNLRVNITKETKQKEGLSINITK